MRTWPFALCFICLFSGPAAGQGSAIEVLAGKLTAGLNGDSAKLRALHDWVASHIAYDYKKFQSGRWRLQRAQDAPDPSQAAGQVYRSRKAVCEGYANLLQAMGRMAGIRMAVIDGQGRPEAGTVFAHGWNAAWIDGKWWLLDVTWAAGGVDLAKERFVPRYDDTYFLMAPETFILSHYPADPAWQLLPNPVTRREFEAGHFRDLMDGAFAYSDTLALYAETDSLIRMMASLRRTIDFDPGNSVAKKNLESMLNFMENMRMDEANRMADAAVKAYNECVSMVNSARQGNDTRLLDDNEERLRGLLASSRVSLGEAIAVYETIRFTDSGNDAILKKNVANMHNNIRALGEMEKYLDRYFSAPPSGRKRMLH